MSRIFITGSSDGIGLLAARSLIQQGHSVTLHARNADRAAQTKAAAPGAAGILVGDISSLQGMRDLASEANKTASPFDVVVHNAGISASVPFQKTVDGIGQLFAINSLAPYVLTCLMTTPKRLVYTSSTLHSGGDESLKDVTWTSGRTYAGFQAYSDSKLHNAILANAVAKRWKDVESVSVHPGWIKTKVGGSSAPGSAEEGSKTLVDLAAGKSVGTAKYYSERQVATPHPAALDEGKQDELMGIYESLSDIKFPSR